MEIKDKLGVVGEFKEFILRGNVVDMSVGIIVGAAFSKLVDSAVKDILMPPLGLLLGKVDFTNIFLVLKEGAPAGPYNTLAAAAQAGAVTINFGQFANVFISLVVVGLAVFMLVKAINRLRREPAAAPAAATTKECPYCFSTVPIKASRCPFCTSELGAESGGGLQAPAT